MVAHLLAWRSFGLKGGPARLEIHRRPRFLALSGIALLLALATGVLLRPGAGADAAEALYPGWNSIVYDGTALPPVEAFASLGDALSAVYAVPPAGSGADWAHYLPSLAPGLNTLTTVTPGQVYWISLSRAGAFVPAPAPTPTPPSAPGEGWRVVEQGRATWYGPGFEGNGTACGEIFNPSEFTAASNTLPCGTVARVTNTNSDLSVIVRINDRGGFRPPLMIDLAWAAFDAIAPASGGVIPVIIEIQ
ncbi:MAG: septal ring lytic transglycosylase RlpA family protein [Dehalococcoidia bacterium]|nr:septal ring lytic transglycosylase RlpA family protein [Dehalococcoidia bacterium]